MLIYNKITILLQKKNITIQQFNYKLVQNIWHFVIYSFESIQRDGRVDSS